MVSILMKNVDQLIHQKNKKKAVKKHKAHVGISFDGDADRIIMCDEKGKIIDGDQIIAMLARRWKYKKKFKRWCCWNINV